MAAKKYYAVKKGKIIGIFRDWDACKASVDGFPGAAYKGFTDLEEAKGYMEGLAYEIHFTEESSVTGESEGTGRKSSTSKTGTELPDCSIPDGLVAYVDGSYEHSLLKYAFGCVFLLPDGRIYTQNGSGTNEETAKLRNVSGEMLGSMYAVKWAIKNGFSKIEIRYDYEGIEKWVTGAWKSKTDLTMKYSASMREWSKQIRILFTKVAAHTNVYYNEMADQLAKAGLEEKEEIPRVLSIEEMTPWKQ